MLEVVAVVVAFVILLAFMAVIVWVGLRDAYNGVTSNEDMLKKDKDE